LLVPACRAFSLSGNRSTAEDDTDSRAKDVSLSFSTDAMELG